jgi:hypothetical protein
MQNQNDLPLFAKQVRFAQMVPALIEKAFELGYQVTIGDAFRDPRLHGIMGKKVGYGAASSCHKIRLAIDLNLFKDGEYLTEAVNHLMLGQYWEAMGGTWGGRFDDANHYSLEHMGHR